MKHSLASKKTRKPSPTPVLIDVLRSAGYRFALPKDLKAHHVDLSYVKPGEDFKTTLAKAGKKQDRMRASDIAGENKALTLQSILAQYNQHVIDNTHDHSRSEKFIAKPGLEWTSTMGAEDRPASLHGSLRDKQEATYHDALSLIHI